MQLGFYGHLAERVFASISKRDRDVVCVGAVVKAFAISPNEALPFRTRRR